MEDVKTNLRPFLALLAAFALALGGLRLDGGVAVAAEARVSVGFVSDATVSVVELGRPAVAAWVHPAWPQLAGATAIWTDFLTDTREEFGPFTFRTKVQLPANAIQIAGSLQVTADNAFELWVNGVFVGAQGYLAQSVPCTTSLVVGMFLWSYDFGSHLRPGPNTIDVRAVNFYETLPVAGVCGGQVFGVHGLHNPAMVLFSGNVSYVEDVVPPTIAAVSPLETSTDALACVRSGLVLTPPAASDNSGVVTVKSDAPTVFPLGTTLVTWTAADPGGNTATTTQTVTVRDTERPRVTAPPALTVGTGPGATGAYAVVSDAKLGSATAADNCGIGSVARTGVPAGNLFPVGTTTLTYTAADAAGNAAVATQAVTVVDDTPPVLSVPASVTADATSTSGTLVVYSVSATDNVGVASLACAPASGTTFPVGETTVSCAAKDAAGNGATASFVVLVRGSLSVVDSLLAYVDGLALDEGAKQSLVAKIEAARRSMEAGRSHTAANQLRALVNHVLGRYFKAREERAALEQEKQKAKQCQDTKGGGSEKGKSVKSLNHGASHGQEQGKGDEKGQGAEKGKADEKGAHGKPEHGSGTGKQDVTCAPVDGQQPPAVTTQPEPGRPVERRNELTLEEAEEILVNAYLLIQVLGSK